MAPPTVELPISIDTSWGEIADLPWFTALACFKSWQRGR